jgi:hypothetical protein
MDENVIDYEIAEYRPLSSALTFFARLHAISRMRMHTTRTKRTYLAQRWHLGYASAHYRLFSRSRYVELWRQKSVDGNSRSNGDLL